MNILVKLEAEAKKYMTSNDPAHDFEHIMRVYRNAEQLTKKESSNKKLVLSSVLLHDIVSYPKSNSRSKQSSVHSSKKAIKILKKYKFSNDEIKIISDAIRDHSFTKHTTPQTLVGKILQDADRLDAIGAIGLARVFSVSGSASRPFYNPADPFCSTRKPDDKVWALDHFYKKLLLLEKQMNTKSAKIEAKRRTKILKQFLSDLKKEL